MGRIPDEEVERLKREVSVERLAQARGVELRRHGADLLGLCPFHNDKEPSLVVSPEKNLWHCLGACQAGGSSIDWVMKSEGISFRHAAELLRVDAPLQGSGTVKQSTVRRLPAPVDASAEDNEALKQVVGYYHEQLKQSPEALDYLEARGLKSSEAIDRFKLGFANRTLGLRLPTASRKSGAEVRGRLQKLGVLRESGHEHFNGSLVVPVFDEAGNVTEMYGRKVTPNLRIGTPNHLYLPGPHQGVWNIEAVKACKQLILCEALLDALTFWCAGYRNVTASYGVEGFTKDHLEAFKKYGVEEVLIAYDRDAAGDKAAETLAVKLMEEGITCYRLLFPRGMDANEYALKVQPASKSLRVVIQKAAWMGKGQKPPQRDYFIEELAVASVPATAVASELTQGLAAPIFPLAAVVHAEPLPESSQPAGTTGSSIVVESEGPSPGPLSPSLLTEQEAAAPALIAPPAASASTLVELASLALGVMASAPPPAVSTSAAPAPPAPAENSTAPAASPVPAMPRVPEVAAEVKEEEVVIRLGDRRYRVRGLGKNLSPEQLKVNLLCAREGPSGAGGAGFHVDTLDLYSARQRAGYVKQTSDELRLEEEVIRRDLGKVLLKLEELQEAAIRKAMAPKEQGVALSDEETVAGLELLKSEKLLERILKDFERCGVVGEETNKLVGYLGAVSRKLEEPLAVIIQSSSAAGKSSLMEAVLAFIPEEERVQYSAMTGQSLFYMGETDLKHKVLAIAEEEGATRAAYALKLLQSEGQLTIASTGKDPETGRLVTQEYRVEGPVMIFLTTTAIEIDEELLNRCVVLTVDEDREQTRAIHRLQRERQTLEGLLARREREDIMKLHQNAQRLLRPLLVANPYARELTFLDDRTRTRRDHVKYLTLIRTIALLHQHQRPVKTVMHQGKRLEYVEVTLEDIAVANRLCHQVLGRSLDELPPHTRRLLVALDRMVTEACREKSMERKDLRFSRRDIRERLGLSYEQARVHLERLVAFEYLFVHKGGRGQSFAYELAYDGKGQDGRPFLIGLIEVERLSTGTTGSLGGEGGGIGVGLGARTGAITAGLGSGSSSETPSSGEDFCLASGESRESSHLAASNGGIMSYALARAGAHGAELTLVAGGA